MTTTLTTQQITRATARPRRPRALVVAGVAYSAAWCAGLLVYGSSTDVTSSGAAVLRSLRGHEGAASLQYVLTEVVAGLALAAVVVGMTRGRSVPRLLGCAAAAISVAQGVVGVGMCAALVDRGSAGAIGTTTHLLNVADGVKMLLLAATLVTLARSITAGGVGLPRWWSPVAVLTSTTLVVSGVGYLLAAPALAAAAWVSLPLLLISVTSAAIAAARAS